MKKKISTVIIAKNEADRIAKCIESALPVSDEVLVLDTGSTDDTIKISEEAGATVVEIDWSGYGPTKNKGSQMAKNDWILSLDADEILSVQLQEEISRLRLERSIVYKINRLVYYKGKPIFHCGLHPDWVNRLYHKKLNGWNDAKVHEKLISSENIKFNNLTGLLHHYSFRNTKHFKNKIDQYARLSAEEWIKQGKGPNLIRRLLGPTWKYFKTYYLDKGYKDGLEGKEVSKLFSEGVKLKMKYYQQFKKQLDN